MVSDLEQKWAVHAHQMLRHAKHIRITGEQYGSPDIPELDGAGLRWPGYLGADARPGTAVLAIASIHRGFMSGTMASQPGGKAAVGRLVEATGMLQSVSLNEATEADYQTYIDGHRHAYEIGLSKAWGVGTFLRQALEYCGINAEEPEDIRSIVYINASCCQFPEATPAYPGMPPDPDAAKGRLKEICLQAHELKGVIDIVQPRVVLCMPKEAVKRLDDGRATHNADVAVCFNQRNGTLMRRITLDGEDFLPGQGLRKWWGPL